MSTKGEFAVGNIETNILKLAFDSAPKLDKPQLEAILNYLKTVDGYGALTDAEHRGYLFAPGGAQLTSSGWVVLGEAIVGDDTISIAEGPGVRSGAQATFIVPENAHRLEIDLRYRLSANEDGPGDAFEIALLDGFGNALGGFAPLSRTDASLNIQSGGQSFLGDRVALSAPVTEQDGMINRTATISLQGLEAGSEFALYLDLLGFGALDSQVEIDRIALLEKTGENSVPEATGTSALVDEDGSVLIDLRGEVSDPDSDLLTIAIVDQPSHGTLQLQEPGIWRYRPAADYHGQDSFTFRASDGLASSNLATVDITVSPVNDAPTAADLSAVTAYNQAYEGNLPAAADVDGDEVVYALSAAPSHGTVTVEADGRFTYTPATGYSGGDSFTYTVQDPLGASNSYLVSFTILSDDNSAPVADDLAIETPEDTAYEGGLPAATDLDGDAVTFALATAPAHGTATVQADGSFRYEPDPDFNGDDGFTFSVSDPSGATNTYSVDLVVLPVNDAPRSADGHWMTRQGRPKAGHLTQAWDVEGDQLTYSLRHGPAHGSVEIETDGRFVYRPATGFHGEDTFTFIVTDEAGDWTEQTATLSVEMSEIGDETDPGTIGGSVGGTSPTGGASSLGHTNTGVEAGASPPLTVTVSAPLLQSDPQSDYFRYVPPSGYAGGDQFGYSTSSSSGRRPLLVAEDTPYDGTLRLERDREAGRSFGLDAGPSHGSIVLKPDGSFRYVPERDYSGPDRFSYFLTDADGNLSRRTVNLSITPVNDAPEAGELDVEATPNGPTEGKLPRATDADGDEATYHLKNGPDHGAVEIEEDGTFQYRPEEDFVGADSFRYEVVDPTGASTTHTVTLLVGSGADPSRADHGGDGNPREDVRLPDDHDDRVDAGWTTTRMLASHQGAGLKEWMAVSPYLSQFALLALGGVRDVRTDNGRKKRGSAAAGTPSSAGGRGSSADGRGASAPDEIDIEINQAGGLRSLQLLVEAADGSDPLRGFICDLPGATVTAEADDVWTAPARRRYNVAFDQPSSPGDLKIGRLKFGGNEEVGSPPRIELTAMNGAPLDLERSSSRTAPAATCSDDVDAALDFASLIATNFGRRRARSIFAPATAPKEMGTTAMAGSSQTRSVRQRASGSQGRRVGFGAHLLAASVIRSDDVGADSRKGLQ